MSYATMTKRVPVQDTDGGNFHINASPSSTLFDVRLEMTDLRSRFLNAAQPGHFRFFVNGTLLTIAEERSKRAWDIIEAAHSIILLPSTNDPVIEESKKRAIEEDSSATSSNKKTRNDSEQTDQNCSSLPPTSTETSPTVIDLSDESSTVTNSPGGEMYTAPYVCPTLDTFQPVLVDLEKHKNVPAHIKIDQAHEKCIELLNQAKAFINDKTIHRFCPAGHRDEWIKEIDELAKQPEPEIVIGCLGGTGVGKSSLLKALLHEDNILPTSSSRGCTAAVVELKFNRDFLKPEGRIIVYRGLVDFVSLQEWKDELELLVDDCCNEESAKVSHRRREENEDTAAAWSKIDSVYGSGTMQSFNGKDKKDVFKSLSEDERVVSLLGSSNCQTQHNFIEVTEGQVTAEDSRKVLQILSDPDEASDTKLARQKKRWAESFRKKINSYVYRKGNGKEPQTWPLIRKVVLWGPWKVLSTGACLVDLPGVRDDNAARAKVAEKYLQKCTKIWIVSPIKRAVDDKTAKDLLGEEFKRRLLMDGNYGNVSFVCTHSDDCEISEILQDHEDIAKEKEGRWERMMSLRDSISMSAKSTHELEDEVDDIAEQLQSCQVKIKKIRLTSKQPAEETSGLVSLLEQALVEERDLQERLVSLRECLDDPSSERDFKRKDSHQRLRILASEVRNEFSRKSLQEDFRSGIENLVRKPEDQQSESGPGTDGRASGVHDVLPADFCLEVFCTASNEYLKLRGVKVGTDGTAACFASPEETGIPDVMQSVLDATEKFRVDHATTFLKRVGNVFGRIYLYASECKVDAKAGELLSKAFKSEMTALVPFVKQIALDFGDTMEKNIRNNLEPHLRIAATRGDVEAFGVVNAWFSSQPRNRQEPRNKGLHWATFGAAARRGGVYKSSSAGPISLNQELYNPLEKEYCASWREVMVAELNRHLSSARMQLLEHCNERLQSIGTLFRQIGMDSLTIQWMQAAGKQGCESIIDGAFRKIRQLSTKKARKLNRSNIPKLRKKMNPTYAAVSTVARGSGTASRQVAAMKAGAKTTLTLNEFDPLMTELNKEVVAMVKELAHVMLDDTNKDIEKCLEQVCCLSWHDEGYVAAMADSRVFVEVFDSRNALLPNLVRLCDAHDNILDYLSIPRDRIQRVTQNNPEGYKEAKLKLLDQQ